MATKIALKNAAGEELAPRTDYSVVTNSPLLNYSSTPVYQNESYLNGLDAHPERWGNGLFMICGVIQDNNEIYFELPLLINTTNSALRQFQATTTIPSNVSGVFYNISYRYNLDTTNFSGDISK